MIDIRLSSYSDLAVHVDACEGTVHFEQDIEGASDVLPFSVSTARKSPGIDAVLAASGKTLTSGDSATVRLNRTDLAELVGEVDRLRWLIANTNAKVACELEPDEARALAAALRHFAKEVERR